MGYCTWAGRWGPPAAGIGSCFGLVSAPNAVSLVNSLPLRPTLNLRPSPCVRHIAQPMSPARSKAHPARTPLPTPDPIRARYPEKNVTFPRHPFPALPHPTPHTSCPSPRLRRFSPPIRPDPANSPSPLKYTHIRATFVHGRGGFQTRPKDRLRGPETLPPRQVRSQASVGASKTGHRPLTRPPALFCHAASLLCPASPRRRYRFAQDHGHAQLGVAQNVAETNRFRPPAPRKQRFRGAPGNLKQAPGVEGCRAGGVGGTTVGKREYVGCLRCHPRPRIEYGAGTNLPPSRRKEQSESGYGV